MQLSTNSQLQNLNQTQKTGNPVQPQTQNLNQNTTQNPYQQLTGQQNVNLEVQLKQTLLNFLQNLSTNSQSKTEILEMLKSTNLFKDFSSASSLLKSIQSGVQTNPSLQNYSSPIQSFLTNIENLSSENLKQNITNSGVFLESKLLQNQRQNISNDMKGLLLNLKQDLESMPNADKELLKQTDKMLIQIDYYQLLSLTSNSQFTYLPFDWDMLDEGDISFYKDEEEFVCNIKLHLKEFGEIEVSLRLIDDKNLSINFFIEDENFKEILRENLPKLKQNLSKQGLSLSNLSLKDIQKENTQNNPYGSNESLSLNFDIRV